MDSPRNSAGYVEDTQIAEASKTAIQDVQNWLTTLESKGFVERAGIIGGFSAQVTAKGQLVRLTSTDSVSRTTNTRQASIKVVPKGLRSFDEHDADFFLELLPGPRRGDGLPESVHFWKVRIEEMDPDKTFRVGYIFGRAAAASRPWSKPVCSLVFPSPSSPSTSRRPARTQKPDCSEDCVSTTPTCPPTSISVPHWSLPGIKSGRDQTRSCL